MQKVRSPHTQFIETRGEGAALGMVLDFLIEQHPELQEKFREALGAGAEEKEAPKRKESEPSGGLPPFGQQEGQEGGSYGSSR